VRTRRLVPPVSRRRFLEPVSIIPILGGTSQRVRFHYPDSWSPFSLSRFLEPVFIITILGARFHYRDSWSPFLLSRFLEGRVRFQLANDAIITILGGTSLRVRFQLANVSIIASGFWTDHKAFYSSPNRMAKLANPPYWKDPKRADSQARPSSFKTTILGARFYYPNSWRDEPASPFPTGKRCYYHDSWRDEPASPFSLSRFLEPVSIITILGGTSLRVRFQCKFSIRVANDAIIASGFWTDHKAFYSSPNRMAKLASLPCCRGSMGELWGLPDGTHSALQPVA
jgi:hypothetical protein